MSVAITV